MVLQFIEANNCRHFIGDFTAGNVLRYTDDKLVLRGQHDLTCPVERVVGIFGVGAGTGGEARGVVVAENTGDGLHGERRVRYDDARAAIAVHLRDGLPQGHVGKGQQPAPPFHRLVHRIGGQSLYLRRRNRQAIGQPHPHPLVENDGRGHRPDRNTSALDHDGERLTRPGIRSGATARRSRWAAAGRALPRASPVRRTPPCRAGRRRPATPVRRSPARTS